MSAMGQRERIKDDFYKTPKVAFAPLIPFLGKVRTWEPAMGDGRLVRWMTESGIPCIGSDISRANPTDFLEERTPDELEKLGNVQQIVTNPPYRLGRKFAEKALGFTSEVWFLMRINFLASDDREEFWKKYPLSALFTLCKRPEFAAAVKCKSCGAKWYQDIESPRPKNCVNLVENEGPKLMVGKIVCGGNLEYNTTDACEYAWFYWGPRWKGFYWL